MEESVMEDVDEIDTIITELEISKGRGNLILCVVNSPAYRERIIKSLRGRFLSEVIYVENGEQIIRTLKSHDFDDADILIWVMPEEPTEDILDALNNFRELFYEAGIPSLVFYNQAFSDTVIRRAPDFWRYRGNYYELKGTERGKAFEAIETLATTLSYQSKDDLLRRRRINEYLLGRVRDRREKAKITTELGMISYNLGELDRALECFKNALKLYEEIGSKEGIATDYVIIGNVYRIRGELDTALQYYEKALKLYEEIGSKAGIAADYVNIGNVHLIKGELDTALQYFEKALKLYEELDDKAGIAAAYGNIGNVYLTRGKLDTALRYYEKSLKLNEEIGRKVGVAIQYGNIGNVYRIRGELDKALQYFTKALKIFRELGSRIETARILMNIGDVFAQKGEEERALSYYREAKELAKGSDVLEAINNRLSMIKES